ncbi:sugar ABC transporter permease [Intrasporangium oryzae NRRL B-24470]|uniref:Sugar ABC transporter permease n=1 Tax=Intrasporangium oryzae NRRL B-24470 TaxID=1386089 RepID=W9GBQ8_9MICO|nr:carbohydrate ABC transporter permease [Intrasporangium oryzae]EWT01304.1 sugar ABC transporter permease [Intrasporangium oryzae NRRL B-24470]
MLRSLRDTAPKTILLTAAALFSIFPLLSMFSAALQPQGTAPAGISFPTDPQWHNFVDAWNLANITTLVKSSSILVLGVVPIAMLISAMAAYAIAQLRIPFGNVFFLLLLLGLTLPYEIVVVPLYYQMQSLGLLNTQLGLILPLIGLNMPFAVFWMRTHFQSVPLEISESSWVDGAGPWKAFRHIQLPLAVPALASLGVLMFLSTWNQFLLAIVLIDDPSKRTMAGALQGFIGAHSTDVVLLNAGALLIMAPTILIFLVFQKYFIRAMLAGAVKG